MHRYGLERRNDHIQVPEDGRLCLQLRNDRNIVTIWCGTDRQDWQRFPVQMEVSGYHHNVAYDFLSLRQAICAAGPGAASFRNLTCRAFA